jgi:lipoprotein-anchoring transpeptidase ErfK/SrfK
VKAEGKEGGQNPANVAGANNSGNPDDQQTTASRTNASGSDVNLATHGAGSAAEAQARRLIQALRARDYADVEVDAGLQSNLLGNPAGLYALEVGLALQRPDGPSADLARRSDALVIGGDGEVDAEGPSLLCAGMQTLLQNKRPSAALEALGSENGFMSTKPEHTSEMALQVFLNAMKQQDEEEAALRLSSLVTRMTRGTDPWTGSRYEALVKAVKGLYGVLDEVLLTPEGVWRSSYVTIGKGDSLSEIANRFEKETGVPVAPGLIQLVNGISNANRIRAGKRLRIPTDRMEIVVSRRTFTMRVYLGDLLLRVYQVGIGKNKRCETPLGTFKVVEKQVDPVWYRPEGGVIPAKDPRNLLGRYFIKLEHPTFEGFGIHGTKDQATVGKRSSLGCIRVRDADMHELFSIVPRKTRVRVED